MMRRATRLVLVPLLLGPIPAWAQTPGIPEREPLRLPRLSGPISLDGQVDEPAWEAIAPLPVVQYQPTYGEPPTERTEIRVAYDDEYIYVSGRLYDSEPRGVRGNTLYRDSYSGDDTFAIILDTFNDNENALWFFTTPLGIRTDMAITNDGTGGFASVNQDWNTWWDVATHRDDRGWFAEIRIPLSSLGFQSEGDRVVMGMAAYRYIARKNERHTFPDIPPKWDRAFSKPSLAQDVILEGVESREPVYITPYALAGIDQQATLDATRTRFGLDTDRTNELGIDLKYNLTDNLTLDATVNTDFAQVEADDQQINLTRFSLFFPEKRQFFQERAGIFNFNFVGASRLFHSRRIGLHEGRPIRILGGTRLVGRAGSWDIGLLDMQTASSSDLPSENFGVLRLRRRVFNTVSNVGLLVTSRVGDDGRYNLAYGVDGLFRLIGDEYLTLKWAQTVDRDAAGGTDGGLDAGRLFARWERRRSQGLSYQGTFGWSGPQYDPGMGFQTRRDFLSAGGTVSYEWLLGAGSALRRIALQQIGQTFVRNGDGTVETGVVSPLLTLESNTGAMVSLFSNNNFESVTAPFEVAAQVEVPVGDYWFHEGGVEFQAPEGALLRPNGSVSAGSFYDGWRVAFNANPIWNLSRHLELQGNYQLNLIRFPDRDQRVDTHLGRLRMRVALNTHFSTNVFVQYNSAADLVSVNARLRYHFGEGNDLWLVYNEGLNTDRRQPGQPVLPLTNDRAVLLKYTYTFIQ